MFYYLQFFCVPHPNTVGLHLAFSACDWSKALELTSTFTLSCLINLRLVFLNWLTTMAYGLSDLLDFRSNLSNGL